MHTYIHTVSDHAVCVGGGGKKGNVTMCKGSEVKASSLKGVVDGALMGLASEGLPLAIAITFDCYKYTYVVRSCLFDRHTSFVFVLNLGADGIPLIAVVRLVKLAHCYEMWDVLDTLLEPTIAAVAVS